MIDKPLESIELPSEAEAWPRVTEVIKSTLAAPELVEFSYYQAIDIVAGLVDHLRRQPEYNGFGGESEGLIDVMTDADWIREVLVENKMTPRDILFGLADQGIEGHEFLEGLAKQSLEDDESAMWRAVLVSHLGDGHKKAIASWWVERQPTVLASEQQVWSQTYRFRGTLDLYWKTAEGERLITDLKNRKANPPCAVNHKTPESAANCHEVGAYRSDHVQTGAYFIALTERLGSTGPVRVDGRTVLVARKDGTWGEYRSTVEPDTFLSLLDVYHKLRR